MRGGHYIAFSPVADAHFLLMRIMTTHAGVGRPFKLIPDRFTAAGCGSLRRPISFVRNPALSFRPRQGADRLTDPGRNATSWLVSSQNGKQHVASSARLLQLGVCTACRQLGHDGAHDIRRTSRLLVDFAGAVVDGRLKGGHIRLAGGKHSHEGARKNQV